MDPREALDGYLRELAPDYTYTVEPLPLEVPGYSFFQGSLDNTRNTRLYWVVRDDGTVLDFESISDLGRIYEAVGILEDPEAATAEELAWMAVCLFVRHQTLVDATLVFGLTQRYQDRHLKEPTLSRTRSGLELVFLTRGIGRNPSFTRHRVTIRPDYQVKHTAKPIRLKLK